MRLGDPTQKTLCFWLRIWKVKLSLVTGRAEKPHRTGPKNAEDTEEVWERSIQSLAGIPTGLP